MSSRLSLREMRLLPHCTNAPCARRAKAIFIFFGAFTQLTMIEVWYLRIIPRWKCCLRLRQPADLVRLQKTG
jgi:hypothetical protein